jgi:hypothetical protein
MATIAWVNTFLPFYARPGRILLLLELPLEDREVHDSTTRVVFLVVYP